MEKSEERVHSQAPNAGPQLTQPAVAVDPIEDRIAQARFHLQQAYTLRADYQSAVYELRACLVAASTARNYAFERVGKTGNGHTWLNGKVAQGRIAFVVKARDADIHGEPITPDKSKTVRVGRHFDIRTSPFPDCFSIEHRYTIQGSPSDEDAFTFLRGCIDEIEKVLTEGKREGYLSAPTLSSPT